MANPLYPVYEEAVQKAHEAGMAALVAAVPVPMVVSGGGQHYYVPDGMCGFGWVHVSPKERSFNLWLKKKGIGHHSYYGGWDISCHEGDQSIARKEAYCEAYAKVLGGYGIRCYAQSRLD